LLDK
jgi:hypothetical protein